MYYTTNIPCEPAPSACVARAPRGPSLVTREGYRFHSPPYPDFPGPLLTGSEEPGSAGVAPRCDSRAAHASGDDPHPWPLPPVPDTHRPGAQPVYADPHRSPVGAIHHTLAAPRAEVFLRPSRVRMPDFHGTPAHGGRAMGTPDPATRPATPCLRSCSRRGGRDPAGDPCGARDQPDHPAAAGAGGSSP